jgi:hypothetical protein
VTREDLTGLTHWEKAFGAGFRGMFVFAYLLAAGGERLPSIHVHPFGGECYAFMCISLADYRASCRTRSASWDTVSMPAARFRASAVPIQVA